MDNAKRRIKKEIMEEQKQATVTIPVEEYIKLKKDIDCINGQDVILRVNPGSALYPWLEIDIIFNEESDRGDLNSYPLSDLLKSLTKAFKTENELRTEMEFKYNNATKQIEELLSYLKNVSWFDFKVYQSELKRNNPTNKRK